MAQANCWYVGTAARAKKGPEDQRIVPSIFFYLDRDVPVCDVC